MHDKLCRSGRYFPNLLALGFFVVMVDVEYEKIPQSCASREFLSFSFLRIIFKVSSFIIKKHNTLNLEQGLSLSEVPAVHGNQSSHILLLAPDPTSCVYLEEVSGPWRIHDWLIYNTGNGRGVLISIGRLAQPQDRSDAVERRYRNTISTTGRE